MVTLESHGPIIFNPSRCSPSDFKAADNKYIQLSNNELGETGRPAVFCTFGSVRDSHLVHGVSLTDEWSNKSLNLCPLILEWDRMVAFFAAVFNLTVVEIRPSRTEGLSFSTRLNSLNSSSSAPSTSYTSTYTLHTFSFCHTYILLLQILRRPLRLSPLFVQARLLVRSVKRFLRFFFEPTLGGEFWQSPTQVCCQILMFDILSTPA